MQIRYIKIPTIIGDIYCSYFVNEHPCSAVCFFSGFASPSSSGTKSSYLLQLAATSRKFDFVCFDYSGTGLSDGVSYENFCISDWYKNCEDVINYFFNNKIVTIIGSSMGGWLGLLFAQRNPKKVDSLIGLAAAPDFTEDLEASTSGPFPREVIEAEFTYKITKNLILDGKKNLFFSDLKNKKIHCPVTLIHGMLDECVNYETSIIIANEIQLSKVILLRNAQHNLSDEVSLNTISNELISMINEKSRI